MYRILFVCHGNICRSPMAEFVFLDMLKKRGITGVTAESAATSTEEIGNPVHYGTAAVLRRLGMRRMGLLRVIAEAEMLRLDPRRVVRRPLRPEPRLPDLPRRIRVCRQGITRQADREFQTVHLLPLPTAEQVPPAVTRPAVRDTPTAAAQVPEAPALALHQLQLRAATRQAAITIIIPTPAA